MKTVKQPLGSKLCFPACIAMVMGLTLQEVLAHVKLHPEGWLPLQQAAVFMVERDYMLGAFFHFEDAQIDEVVDQDVSVSFTSSSAIVTVKSEAFGGCNHCIVWDAENKVFRDPNPLVGDTSSPSDYVFREWMHVFKIQQEEPLNDSRK